MLKGAFKEIKPTLLIKEFFKKLNSVNKVFDKSRVTDIIIIMAF